MIEAITRELSALAEQDRAAILAALSESERARVTAALAGREPDAAPEPGRYSAWMTDLIAAAGHADDRRMTPDTRAALLAAVGRATPPVERATGRSLLQAAGNAFAQVRAR